METALEKTFRNVVVIVEKKMISSAGPTQPVSARSWMTIASGESVRVASAAQRPTAYIQVLATK